MSEAIVSSTVVSLHCKSLNGAGVLQLQSLVVLIQLTQPALFCLWGTGLHQFFRVRQLHLLQLFEGPHLTLNRSANGPPLTSENSRCDACDTLPSLPLYVLAWECGYWVMQLLLFPPTANRMQNWVEHVKSESHNFSSEGSI